MELGIDIANLNVGPHAKCASESCELCAAQRSSWTHQSSRASICALFLLFESRSSLFLEAGRYDASLRKISRHLYGAEIRKNCRVLVGAMFVKIMLPKGS